LKKRGVKNRVNVKAIFSSPNKSVCASLLKGGSHTAGTKEENIMGRMHLIDYWKNWRQKK